MIVKGGRKYILENGFDSSKISGFFYGSLPKGDIVTAADKFSVDNDVYHLNTNTDAQELHIISDMSYVSWTDLLYTESNEVPVAAPESDIEYCCYSLSDTNKLYKYDTSTTAWEEIVDYTVSVEEPVSPSNGDYWYNGNKLYQCEVKDALEINYDQSNLVYTITATLTPDTIGTTKINTFGLVVDDSSDSVMFSRVTFPDYTVKPSFDLKMTYYLYF